MPHMPEGPGDFVKLQTAEDKQLGGETLWRFEDNGYDQVMIVTGRLSAKDIYIVITNPANRYSVGEWQEWAWHKWFEELEEAIGYARHHRLKQQLSGYYAGLDDDTGATGTVDEYGISHPHGSKHEENM